MNKKEINRAVMLDCPIFHALVAGCARELLDTYGVGKSAYSHLNQGITSNLIKKLERVWEIIVLGEVPKDSYRSKDLSDSPFDEEDPLNGT